MPAISPASSACAPSWHDHPPVVAWERLLWNFADLFCRPSFQLFVSLVSAWPLCPGRRTVTRMIAVADPDGEHAHDAYPRFLRAGAWSMARLWGRLTLLMVATLELPKTLLLRGELAAARPLRERALAIRERVLGHDHPETAATKRQLEQTVSSSSTGARALKVWPPANLRLTIA